MRAHKKTYADSIYQALKDFSSYTICEQIPYLIKKLFAGNSEFKISYVKLIPQRSDDNNLLKQSNYNLFDKLNLQNQYNMSCLPDGFEYSCHLVDIHNSEFVLSIGVTTDLNQKSGSAYNFPAFLGLIQEAVEYQRKKSLLLKDNLISKMVHQLRNPLATIITSISQLTSKTDDTVDDDDRLLMGFINSEAARIEKYLEMYVKYANSIEIEPRQIEFNAFMEDLNDRLEESDFKDFRIDIKSKAHEKVLKLYADSEKLHQAILILLENAFDSISDSQNVNISTTIKEDHICLTVSDKGKGIRPELLRKVKEPFYSTKEGGSGLGLSIASQIANMHGGDLEISSLPDRKTDVTIKIPKIT